MENSLQSLYNNLKLRLSNPKEVMKDDILKLLVEIELAIQGILGNQDSIGPLAGIDGRRIRRYGLDKEGAPEFIMGIAREATLMQHEIGKGLSVQHLLAQVARAEKRILESLGSRDYQEIFESLGIIATLHADGQSRPFVPTRDEISPRTGSGNGWENERREPKFLELLEILKTIKTPDGGHIDTRDILVDYQSSTPDDMMRTLPYIIVRIPRLNRTILINDRIGEATFVFMGIQDIGIFKDSQNHKGIYETEFFSRRIEYVASWGANIRESLTNDWNDDTTDSTPNIPRERQKMNYAQLFLDAERIRCDLEAFANELGIHVGELTTNNLSTEFTLSNRVRVNGRRYLNNASGFLLGTKKESANPHRQGEALEKLCEIAGIVRINEEYFRNKEFVRKDLEAIAAQAGIQIVEMTTSNPKIDTKIVLSNGVTMQWSTYLNNASNFLLGTVHKKDNPPRRVEALEKLCEIAGIARIKSRIKKSTLEVIVPNNPPNP